jgi:putative mRNA 3-end processing factor
MLLKFTSKGIYCPQGKFYIDPWRPVERAIITHGHADHARPGMQWYLCHHYTKPILFSRISPSITCESMDYGEQRMINGVKVSFHPAGHIIGSAQIRMEYKGYVAVVSGDYKLQNDGISTPFEPVKCHAFVTESTFGLPIYQWLPVAEQEAQLQQWVLHNQQQQKTSVLIGYSLGKAQRIMKSLEGLGPLHVHYSIAKLNQAMEQAGVVLPAYTQADLREDMKVLDGGIVILPPAFIDHPSLKKIPNMVYGICSGWMQVRGARRWRSADAGFAISDHADWPDLLTAIKATEAQTIYVTHGQTAVFSKYLNEQGWTASEVQTSFGEEDELIEETT